MEYSFLFLILQKLNQLTAFFKVSFNLFLYSETKILTAKPPGIKLNTQTIPMLKSKTPQAMPEEVHEVIHFKNGRQNFSTGS